MFFVTMPKSSTYRMIKEEDDSSDQEFLLHEPVKQGRSRSVLLAAVILLLIASNLATWNIARHVYAGEDTAEAQLQSKWMREIDQKLYVRHDNQFEHYSAFTLPVDEGGDSVEERWLDLGLHCLYCNANHSEQAILMIYLDPSMLLPEEYAADFNVDKSIHSFVAPGQHDAPPDLKSSGFPVRLEMTHQLHCLNFLRQGLYFNYQYYKDTHHMSWNDTNEESVRAHLSHCVDSLRQHIMCGADTRVHPYLKSTDGQFGDFGLPRKCRNWESARDFAAKHSWSRISGPKRLDDRHRLGEVSPLIDNFPGPIHTKLRLQMQDVPRWPAERLWTGH
jgi:hypothetical protein